MRVCYLVHIAVHGKRIFADGIGVVNFRIRRLSWITPGPNIITWALKKWKRKTEVFENVIIERKKKKAGEI